MVAKIKPSNSIHRILNYNENKVKEGVAKCIGAGNYPVDHDKMSFNMKLNLIEKQNQLRDNVKVNSVHISLNFDITESYLQPDRLVEIAESYMQKIGFGDQPYLVYQHHDAGHPHIHIVTTNIQADGQRISLHHLGINKSEPARKAIEKEFDLVVAESKQKPDQDLSDPLIPSKATYGKSDTKRAIQNVLDHVLKTYKYASLPELNAVLKKYNVTADSGTEHSRIRRHNGLIYHILNASGKTIGVPIKASSFYSKPTLNFLKEQFKQNELTRIPFKSRTKNKIDLALSGQKITLDEFVKKLQQEGIDVELRRSDNGLIYGITYIDHQTKCVFNGSALGKRYSAKSVLERCASLQTTTAAEKSHASVKTESPQTTNALLQPAVKKPDQNITANPPSRGLIDLLLQPETDSAFAPNQFKKRRKKRKKRNTSSNN